MLKTLIFCLLSVSASTKTTSDDLTVAASSKTSSNPLLDDDLTVTAASMTSSDPLLDVLRDRFIAQQILGVASTTIETLALDEDVTFFLSRFNVINFTFTDIDYTSSSAACWPSANHTIRVRLFLSALLAPQSQYFNSSKLKDISLSALSWWLLHDLTSSNWWDNDISTPLNIGASTLLLAPLGLSLTSSQMNIVTNTILARSSVTNSGTSTGANLLWQGTAIVMRGLLLDNRTLVEHALNASYKGIGVSVAFQDGPQVDGSFFQHGQQIYNGGYGSFYTQTVLALLNLTTGTSLALTDTLRLTEFANFLVDGELRTIFYSTPEAGGALFDVSVCGRGITRPFVGHLANIGLESGMRLPFTSSMLKAWGAPILTRSEEIEAFADLIDFGTNSSYINSTVQVKSQVFFMAEFGVHRRPNWMSTVRFHSRRLLGSECVNDEGKMSGHLADGANYLHRSGREYGNRSNGMLVFPSFDWEKIPGTTVRIGALPLDCEHVSGIFGIRAFAGGVADGSSSHLLMAVDWEAPQKQGLFVRKSWSFFESIYVALGSNVSTVAEKDTTGSQVVVTTIDQRILYQEGGVYTSSSPNSPLPLSNGTEPLDSNVWWVWHDHVGYILPMEDLRGGANVHVANVLKSGNYENIGAFSGNVTVPIFSLWLQHTFGGSLNETFGYAYIVVPDIGLDEFASSGASTILADLVFSRSVESHAVLLKSEGVLFFSVFDEVPKGDYLNVSTANEGFPVGWSLAIGGGPLTGIMKEIEGGGGGGGRGGERLRSHGANSSFIEFSLSDPSHSTPAKEFLISVDRTFTPSRPGEGLYCGSSAPSGWSAEVSNGKTDGSGVHLECENAFTNN